MRMLAFLHKTFLENVREWKILILVLVFAPFFVYLMWGYFSASEPAYGLLVYAHPQEGELPAELAAVGPDDLMALWETAEHADGDPVFEVAHADDLDAAREKLKTRDADLLVEIPADFAARLAAFAAGQETEPALLVNHIDESNARATMAAAMSDYLVFGTVATITGATSPMDVRFESVGTGEEKTEFELYVPALLVLAIIMVMFTAAATLIKEVDKGTVQRLVLSRLSTFEMLAAVSINQVAIGVVALALAYGAAVSVGYRGEGSVLAVLAVGALSTLSVVAISVLVAAFMRTIFELLTVGCFPFFILMFFSDCMFPLPKIDLVRLGGFSFYATDVLPTSLTVRAFNRILNHGASLADVWVELASISVLTALYFVVGTWLFTRRHYRVW
jgi:ABC-2 type transport system permease protein